MAGNPRQPRPDLPRWEQAACRGMDTEMFFPASTDDAGHRAAYRVCSGCPIRAECGAWALEHETHGIWGGLSQNARKRLRDGETP